MQFHDVRFPENISLGAIGGPERRAEIFALANGFEKVNSPWARSKRQYSIASGTKSLDEIDDILTFFESREGMHTGFRWKDWSDYKSCKPSKSIDHNDQLIGFGDGISTVFQLQKKYGDGYGEYFRKITRPVMQRVFVCVDDLEKCEGDDFQVDYGTGKITLNNPPQANKPVSAGFEFDVPVRFDMPSLAINVSHFNAGEIAQIQFVEIWE